MREPGWAPREQSIPLEPCRGENKHPPAKLILVQFRGIVTQRFSRTLCVNSFCSPTSSAASHMPGVFPHDSVPCEPLSTNRDAVNGWTTAISFDPSSLHVSLPYLDVMMSAASLPSNISNRPTYSCIRCADRKVKCDRQRPCGACVKHNADCVFNLAQPPRKKRAKTQILADRLRQYEAVLQEQGIDPNKLPDTPKSGPRRVSSNIVVPKESQVLTPSSIGSDQCVNKTQVVHGQGRSQFVDK